MGWLHFGYSWPPFLANRSPQVRRELERAASADLPIIPLRVEDVAPSAVMEYFLSTPHWLNAFPGPLEPDLEQLTSTARGLLSLTGQPVSRRHRGTGRRDAHR